MTPSGKNKKPPAPTSFRFDDELRAALKIIGKREGRSMSNAIEWLAKDYFKQKKLAWPAPAQAQDKLNQEKDISI